MISSLFYISSVGTYFNSLETKYLTKLFTGQQFCGAVFIYLNTQWPLHNKQQESKLGIGSNKFKNIKNKNKSITVKQIQETENIKKKKLGNLK